MSKSYKIQQVIDALASVALQTSYADAVSFTVPVGSMTEASILVTYTTGSGETSNTIEVKVESGDTATNLYRMTTLTTSGGTVTLANSEYTYTGASAATAYKFAIPLQLADKFLKVSFKESGVAANAGTVAAKLVLSGK